MLRSAILLGSMGYQTTAACDERPPACGSRDSLKTGTNTGPPGKDHRADCERRQSQLKKTRQKTISASDCCQEKIPSKPASRAQFPVGECWNRLTTAIAAIVGTARKSKPRGWATFAVCAKVGFHSPKWDFAFLLLCNWQESSGIGIAGVDAPSPYTLPGGAVDSVASHPCKERKDGPPLRRGGLRAQNPARWATRQR
jgi:hypothetical protein